MKHVQTVHICFVLQPFHLRVQFRVMNLSHFQLSAQQPPQHKQGNGVVPTRDDGPSQEETLLPDSRSAFVEHETAV